MRWSLGAEIHEPSGTSVAPTEENSSSSKIRSGLCSTLTLKPASRRAFVVLGVTEGLTRLVEGTEKVGELTSGSVLQRFAL